jgi:Protein of unknown function (DUF642)
MIRALAIGSAFGLAASAAAISLAASATVRPGPASRAVHPSSAVHLMKRVKCPVWPYGTGLVPYGDWSGTTDPGNTEEPTKFGKRFSGWRGTYLLAGSTFFQLPYSICSVEVGNQDWFRRRIKLEANTTYTVSFILSGNGNCANTSQSVRAGVDGRHWSSVNDYTWDTSNGNDAQHGAYQMESWQFTVPDKYTKLTDLAFRGLSACGPVISAISIVQD